MIIGVTTPDCTGVNPPSWSQDLGFDQGQLRTGPQAVLTIAAQGSLDAQGRLLHEDDPAAQLALAIANLESVLAGAGLGPGDLAQLRLYTTDMHAALAVRDTLVERLAEFGARPPTTLVEVSRLPVPGMTMALEALAIR